MELIFLAAGFVLGVIAMGATVRRAKQHPEGKSAKFLSIL